MSPPSTRRLRVTSLPPRACMSTWSSFTAAWNWRRSSAWPMPSSTWCPPATRSRPTTWWRSSASWTSAPTSWSTRPRSSSSRHRCAASLMRLLRPSLPPRTEPAVERTMTLVAAPARLSTAAANFEADFAARLHWSADTDAAIEQRVADILADVQKRGDAAVLEYTARFDGLSAPNMAALELTQADFKAAFDAIPQAQRDALQAAAKRVRSYHEAQKKASGESWSYRDEDGTLLGQKVTPLDRVGIYVPGGKAAYPSSLLMNAIPAHVAGVQEIIMVVPTPVRGSVATGGSGEGTSTRGERNELVLAAAYVAGVTRAFTIGGAQAVAALAYGTATVPKGDKITGPGNAHVASAKKRVFGTVGIDMIAGPSEILVLADGSTPPDWVAMDLFSQAEHDELAQSILLCPDAAYLDAVQREIDRLLPTMPRAEIIAKSLTGRGALILTKDMEEACAISNRIAPEHLEVSSTDPHRWEPLLRHAGAIFLGAYTSESLGDYCAGPNHVLPTSGTARFSSPLGVYDFQKRSSIIEVSEAGAQVLGTIAAELAYGEGLQAHAQAAEMRLKAGVKPRCPPPGAGHPVWVPTPWAEMRGVQADRRPLPL